MFQLKVFKTQVDAFSDIGGKKNSDGRQIIHHLSDKASCGPRTHAAMLFFFLVKRVFSTASLTFQQYSSPTCFYHAASQKPPHFIFSSVSRFFGLFGIFQR